MRRYNSPFDGKRFLYNKNTGEIHDLDNEMNLCQIDKIKPEHIYMADTYEQAELHSIFVANSHNPNGCHYCNSSKDNG